MGTSAAKHVGRGEGRTVTVIGGDRITFKATAEDTHGAYSLLETVTDAGAGLPPHVHRDADEAFYVLEGTFEFHVGDQVVCAGPGSFLVGPRAVPHWFQNVGTSAGRLLVTVSPGGAERFFEALAAVSATVPPDIARIKAVAAEHGVDLLV